MSAFALRPNCENGEWNYRTAVELHVIGAIEYSVYRSAFPSGMGFVRVSRGGEWRLTTHF
jgi:hypothetical protein